MEREGIPDGHNATGADGTQQAIGHPPTSPWRWCLHLLLLTAYPLTLGAIGFIQVQEPEASVLPPGPAALLVVSGAELVVFGIIFSLALVSSRAGSGDLMLAWRGGFRPILRGFLYSLLLRGLVILAVALLAMAAFAIGRGADGLEHLRPEVENVVNAKALSNPLYLFLTLTVVSFVVAGLREELWRAGMLAGLSALLPGLFTTEKRRLLSVAAVAVVFGLGHVTQGVGGVIMTTILGFGLGVIMVRYRSVWEAVLAHGFFNATTFALIYLISRFAPEEFAARGL